MSVEKRAIRQVFRARRSCLSPIAVAAAGAAVCAQLRAFSPYQTARSATAYVADDNEIPTALLFDDIAQSHRPLYLPQTASSALIQWRPGEPLVCGRAGVREPLGGRPAQPETPGIVLVPVVGWDAAGVRLGRGGGFYDRLLATLADGLVRVGLAYECLQYPELPRDSWDVELHYVITEQRIVRCGREAVAQPELLQKGGLQW